MAIFMLTIGTVIAILGWVSSICVKIKWPKDTELWFKLIIIGLCGNIIQLLSMTYFQ